MLHQHELAVVTDAIDEGFDESMVIWNWEVAEEVVREVKDDEFGLTMLSAKRSGCRDRQSSHR